MSSNMGASKASSELSNQGKNLLPVKTVQYLTFFTASEEYAISIVKVSEIVEYEAVTTVPNTPPWIRGVTNLRGRVVPVVDLAVKFGRMVTTTPPEGSKKGSAEPA